MSTFTFIYNCYLCMVNKDKDSSNKFRKRVGKDMWKTNSHACRQIFCKYYVIYQWCDSWTTSKSDELTWSCVEQRSASCIDDLVGIGAVLSRSSMTRSIGILPLRQLMYLWQKLSHSSCTCPRQTTQTTHDTYIVITSIASITETVAYYALILPLM